MIPVDDPGLSALPDSAWVMTSIVHFLYLSKGGNGWYADDPLHSNFPPQDWWEGIEYNWDVYDYGFSEAENQGKIVRTQNEMDKWLEYCRNYYD